MEARLGPVPGPCAGRLRLRANSLRESSDPLVPPGVERLTCRSPGQAGRAATELAFILAVIVFIRLPFLRQAVQGDDVYYLSMARNVPVDPLHPMHMGFTFQGRRVSMAGFPHPPLNSYILAILMRCFGGVRERLFHLTYLLFSLIAAAAMYRLARRFTGHPLLATLLFVSVPVFVANGNTLEADLPFLALWMLGFALYFEGNHILGASSLGLAALVAYQGVFAAPILAHHAWYRRRRSKTAWLAVIAGPGALLAWQVFQRVTSGATPAGVLGGYLQAYGLLALVKKLHSAIALTGHLGWIVFPLALLLWAGRSLWIAAPIAAGVSVALPDYLWWQRVLLAVSLAAGLAVAIRWIITLWKERSSEDGFLAAWGLAFFAGAVAVFFAGSARYLLPLAPAVICTVVRSFPRRSLLWGACLLNLAVGLTLASANYQYTDQYRVLAGRLEPLAAGRCVWSGAEWGFRYYLEQIGAEPLRKDQPVYRGALVVESELAGRIPFSAAGRAREVLHADLWSRRPVRLIGIATRSGYSSSDFGVLPFDLGRGLLDRITASVIDLPEPRLSYLHLGDPDAAPQLLSGFYRIEEHAWRWMSGQGVVLLKAPEHATRFEMTLSIPDTAPARRVTVSSNGLAIGGQTYPGPGRYTLTAPVSPAANSTPQFAISVDRTFQTPPDERRLGIIVVELGLR